MGVPDPHLAFRPKPPFYVEKRKQITYSVTAHSYAPKSLKTKQGLFHHVMESTLSVTLIFLETCTPNCVSHLALDLSDITYLSHVTPFGVHHHLVQVVFHRLQAYDTILMDNSIHYLLWSRVQVPTNQRIYWSIK